MPAYELFSSTELLGRMAMERMMAKLSTRRYRVGLEPVGARRRGTAPVDVEVGGVAPLRRRDRTALAEMMAADLSGFDLVALMIDGVHFAEHCCIVALGIGIDGTKAPARRGRGLHRERHRRHRLLVGPAGPGPGRRPGRSWS